MVNDPRSRDCIIPFKLRINNYWMRLSMISWIIKTEVLKIHDTMRKPNSIMVLFYICHIIYPLKQKRSVQPFCFWGEHSKELSNQTDVELDMINAISAADIAIIMSSSQAIYSEVIEWPIRFFIVSLKYNNIGYWYQKLKQYHI